MQGRVCKSAQGFETCNQTVGSMTFTNLPRIQGTLHTISSLAEVLPAKEMESDEVGMSQKKQAGG